jgi:putative sporulation protein YtaF
MNMIGLLFFAIALNIDAFLIAVSYGIRKIKIPLLSLLILSGVSMAAISLSMLTGGALARLLPQIIANYLGGLILIGLGVQIIWEQNREKVSAPDNRAAVSAALESKPAPLVKLSLVKLPFALFQSPELVDLDHSGTIMGWEAFLLGMTLALDAAGAGLAVALQGYSIVLTALFAGGGQLVFTRWGLYWGARIGAMSWGKTVSLLAGGMIMLLGLLKIGDWF